MDELLEEIIIQKHVFYEATGKKPTFVVLHQQDVDFLIKKNNEHFYMADPNNPPPLFGLEVLATYNLKQSEFRIG